MKKKIIIGFITVLLTFFLLEFYGKDFMVFIFNTFQKNICVNSFCIQKPKNWIPYVVIKNNKKYFLNLIEDADVYTDVFLENKSEGIMLNKDEQYISIFYDEIDKNIFKKMTPHKFATKTYYVTKEKTFSIVYSLDDKIVIYMHMNKFDKNIIEEILSYNKKI